MYFFIILFVISHDHYCSLYYELEWESHNSLALNISGLIICKKSVHDKY